MERLRPVTVALAAVAIVIAACAEKVPDVALEQTRWRLVELAGKPVVMPEGAQDPHLRLLTTDHRLEGFAGCNRIMGVYQLDGDALAFPGVAGTRRYCESTAAVEQAFLAALSETRSYRISGTTLELRAGDRVVAKLEELGAESEF